MTSFPLHSFDKSAFFNAPSVKIDTASTDAFSDAAKAAAPEHGETKPEGEDERPRPRGSLQSTSYIRSMPYSDLVKLGLVSPRSAPMTVETDDLPDAGEPITPDDEDK